MISVSMPDPEIQAQRVGYMTYLVERGQLTDQERGLLREILAHVMQGTHAEWAVHNFRRANEVKALFDKCTGQLRNA